MAFRWFSSSSLTVSTKALITTGITVVLTAPIIASPGILVLVIFQVPSIMFWSPGTAILMILQSLLSLLITTISSPQSSISLSVWIAKSQIYYISHSAALALVDARTVCLHIQFQISCTGVNVLFFLQLCSFSSCIDFQIGRNTKWKHGWHFHFSPCRACIRGNTSWWSIQFFMYVQPVNRRAYEWTSMNIQGFQFFLTNLIQLSLIPVDYSTPIMNCCYNP